MARQQNRPYEPEFANLSNSNSPLTPNSRGDTPVQFRTNVNRAKTKRWVEAKKYSYDGNDWGEDEYDEYDDDPTPPMPQYPPNANQSTGNLPSTLSKGVAQPPVPTMDRSRSMEQVETLGVLHAGDNRSRSSERTTGGVSNPQGPIVRPADIYKRMQQDPSLGESPAPNEHPTQVGPSVTESVPKSSYPSGLGPSGDQLPHRSLNTTMGETSGHERPVDGTPTQNDHPALGLPDVKRLSGFGANFFDGTASSSQGAHPEQPPEGHQLQHNPSLGFRSVVHQAFDVPETPSTAVDSVARSNSDSTSGISPIIGSRPFGGEEKTPTIVEEPESTSPPRDFRFGHRRDMSVPSPGNSPSRQPMITTNDPTPPSALAEMSTHTPYDLPPEHPLSRPSNISEGDRPPPLKINVSSESNEAPEGVPVIIPSMSSENSPEDTENDRLRKEIIRSLSRENTPSDEPEAQDRSRPQTGRQDSLIPSEYEHYWSEQIESSPQEQNWEEKSAPGAAAAPSTSQDLYSSAPAHDPTPAAVATSDESRPKVKRRFSWESSSSGEETPLAGVQSPAGVAMPGQFPVASESSAQPDMASEPETKEVERQEKPKLTIITPSAMDSSSISSDQHAPEVLDAQPIPDSAVSETRRSADTDYHTPAPAPNAPPSIESSLLGFRDILSMKTSEDRVQAFNHTRDQFASIDTGLNHWIQMTVHEHPQHSDVIAQSWNQSSAAPKPTVSRGKFPKLPSLGNFGAASHPDGSPSGSGHVRRPSAPLGSMMNKQQVEQRGKDLLHTAGVLGGKAGEAAKGLFAKGRSKFKGGNEKGFQPMRGYRRNIRRSEFEFSSAVDLTELDRDQRRRPTGYFGSLPLAKDGRHRNRHHLGFGIARKGIPTAAESRHDGKHDDTDMTPHDAGATDGEDDDEFLPDHVRGKGDDRPEYVLDLESEMTTALGLKHENHSRSRSQSQPGLFSPDRADLGLGQASSDGESDVSREFAAPGIKHGGADGAAWERSYRDSSSTMSTSNPDVSPLQSPGDKADRPLQKPHRGQCNECRPQVEHGAAKAAFRTDARQRNAVRYFSSSPFPSPRLAPLSTSMSASSARPPAPPVEFSLTDRHGEHRRGSSAPLRLHPTPSISSLGTQDPDLDPNRPRGRMLGDQGNLSRVSLPSDMDDAQPRILGGDEGFRAQRPEAEQRASTATTLLVPSFGGEDDHSFPDTQATPPQQKGRSTMGKIVGKIRRPSTSANAEPKTVGSPSQPQHRSPLDRLSGLFGRQHGRGEHQPQQHLHQPIAEPLHSPGPRTPEFEISSPSMDRLHAVSSQPATPGQPRHHSPGHTRPSSALENASFKGQPPPPEGYFSPFNPDSFSRFRETQEPSMHPAQPTLADRPDIRIPTPTGVPQHTSSNRSGSSGDSSLSPRSPRFVRPVTAATSPPIHQVAYTTTHLTSPVPSPVPRTPPSRGRSEERSYAEDLHFRSRSPKAFAPRPNEKHIPSTDVTDPAHILGTFRSSNPRLSRIGDQESPWKLSLPGLDDETGTFSNWRRHTTGGALPSQEDERLPTYEEDSENHPPPPTLPDEKRSSASATQNETACAPHQNRNEHPTRGQGRALNNTDSPVELPVRREDDSSEEITMSSTAYPGQEWRPLGFSEWEP